MEIAALNERLREAFTPVVQHLAHRERVSLLPDQSVLPTALAVVASPSHSQPLGSTVGDVEAAAARGNALQLRAHSLTVLKRLNTYQYGSLAAFVRDLQQLEQLAGDADAEAARLVQSIAAKVKERERPATNGAPPTKKLKPAAPAVTIHGLRFAYSGVPATQQVSAPTAAQSDPQSLQWRCNVNVQDVVLTMGESESPNTALALYEAQRSALGLDPHGLASLVQQSDQRGAEQQLADDLALREALAVCIPKLASSTAVRVADLVAPATSSAAGISSNSSTRDERQGVVGSPTSSVSSAMSMAPSSAGRTGNWRNPKRKKPAHRLAFLRLRRLIQKKLCSHLRGQSVCVFSRPEVAEKADDSAWMPTGRLENGRVVVLETRKVVNFTEYVATELGRPASACAHMYLVSTRESIDEHLKVCDAFSEEDRAQLGHDLYGSVRNYMQAKEERR